MEKTKFTGEQIKLLEKFMPEITELENKIDGLFSNWVRHIITLLIGLLSVLVAFNSSVDKTIICQVLFSMTLCSLGLSVSMGIIFLYNEVDLQKKKLSFRVESLLERLTGDQDSVHSVKLKRRKIFLIIEWVFYISSFLSIVLLVLYGIIK